MNETHSVRRLLAALAISVLTLTLLVRVPAALAAAPPPVGTDLGPLQRYTVSASAPIPFLPLDVKAESETRMLYVIGQDPVTKSGRLSQQSESKPGVVIKDITLPGTLAHLAIDAPYHRIFITDRVDNLVYVVDDRTLAVITEVAVGLNPCDVQVDPLSHRAFVSNYDSKTVSVIDVPTTTVIATIPIAANPGAIAIDAQVGRVFVVNSYGFGFVGGPKISEVSESSLQVVATIDLGQYGIDDLAVDLVRHQIVAPSFNALLVIDPSRQRIVSLVPIGQTSTHIAVDSRAHIAYLTNKEGFPPNYTPFPAPQQEPQTVSAYTETGAVLGTVQVGVVINAAYPPVDDTGITVDPLTGVAFSVSTDAVAGTIAAIGHSPAALTPAKTHMTVTSHGDPLNGGTGALLFYVTITPVPDGGTVSIFLNGKRVPYKQNQLINPATGVYQVEHLFNRVGTYTLKAVYNGDPQFGAVAAFSTFEINQPYCGTPSAPVPCYYS